VYVKLCQPSRTKCLGLRHTFIREGDRFTMSDIAAGEYEIRYMGIEHRRYAKSSPMKLIELEGSGGTRFSVVTITPYTGSNGNTRLPNFDTREF